MATGRGSAGTRRSAWWIWWLFGLAVLALAARAAFWATPEVCEVFFDDRPEAQTGPSSGTDGHE